MGIILKVKSGPQEGREILVRKGSTLLIGRAAERVQFAVPHDMHMSGVHFAVECGPGGCRVIDRKDTRHLFCPSVRER